VLVNPADVTNTEATLRDVGAAARAIGLQIQVLNASTITVTPGSTPARSRPVFLAKPSTWLKYPFDLTITSKETGPAKTMRGLFLMQRIVKRDAKGHQYPYR